jgi:hypothetical protein
MAFFMDYFCFPGASNVLARFTHKVSFYDRQSTDASRDLDTGHHEAMFLGLRSHWSA